MCTKNKNLTFVYFTQESKLVYTRCVSMSIAFVVCLTRQIKILSQLNLFISLKYFQFFLSHALLVVLVPIQTEHWDWIQVPELQWQFATFHFLCALYMHELKENPCYLVVPFTKVRIIHINCITDKAFHYHSNISICCPSNKNKFSIA